MNKNIKSSPKVRTIKVESTGYLTLARARKAIKQVICKTAKKRTTK